MGHRSHRIYGPPRPSYPWATVLWATVLWATLSTREKNRGREKKSSARKNWQNISWFSVRGENVRISYLYETHQIEFIMLRSLCIWLHSQKFPYAKLKILLSLRLHIKFPATEKIIYSLLRIDTSCDREMKTELSGFKRGLATLWRFQGPVNIIFE